jgi:hypothetical protein
MTDANAEHSHEFVVDAELLKLLRQRGVADDMTVGDRVRLELIAGDGETDPFAGFIGAMHAGADFSARADEILQAGFGRS